MVRARLVVTGAVIALSAHASNSHTDEYTHKTPNSAIGEVVAPHYPGRNARNGELRPLQDIHDELLGKFTPIKQRPSDEALIDHFGDKPFTGDCDDYFIAAYNQLQVWGYVPHAKFVRVKRTGKRHIIACTEVRGSTRCLDPNRGLVRTLRELRKEYRILETRKVL